VKFRSLVSQIGKPVNVAESLANRSSKWVAGHFGVSMRTAQRWKKGTQQPSPRIGGSERVIKSANADTRRTVAADAIRDAQAAHVGRVAVVDKSPKGKAPKPGRNTRNLRTVHVDKPRSRELLNSAADAVERGDDARAERLMNEAVMDAYGGGTGAALSIEDWPPGFHLI
jgi:hypothetical protein